VEVVTQFGGLAEPSVGVTLIEGGSDPHRVLKDASAAMRRARSSPSRVVLYERAATAGASPSRPTVTTTRVIRNRARRRRPRPPL
jgi:hypothetical protein